MFYFFYLKNSFPMFGLTISLTPLFLKGFMKIFNPMKSITLPFMSKIRTLHKTFLYHKFLNYY